MSKKNKNNERFIPRVPGQARESISRHGTVESRKRYRRHGRGLKRALDREIEDQMANSDQKLFLEELEYYGLI